MAAENGAKKWLQTLKHSKMSCIVQDNRKKVHYLLPEGNEMVEEYDTNNGQLLVRKWKKKSTLGGEGKWEYELGEPYRTPQSIDSELLMESSSNPVFTRRDTPTSFQWRIRNLPYRLDNYQVTVDDTKENIVIRTVNKKYYKKFSIPDMQRCGLDLEQSSISIAHSNNTLIITYKKPKVVLDLEKELQVELKKLKSEREGDVECSQN